MQTLVFIRSVYAEEITPLRLSILSNLVIPAWKAQTDSDFKLIILCHEVTLPVLKTLDWGELKVKFVKCFTHGLDMIRKNKEYQQLVSKKDTIQIRYDDDDYPHPDFIRFVHAQFTANDKLELVTFHPTKHVLETGAKYYSQTKWYSANKPSNCVAIKNNKGIGIFEDDHSQMGKYFREKIFIKVFKFHNMTIHSENILNEA